jgi:FkbH-like protein
MDKKVKCVVWDLDNTIWDGILSEDKEVTLKPGIEEIIRTLDERGILQSIASKNDYNDSMKKLREFGLDEFFLYPQINWNSKAESVKAIAEAINIGIDTLAFIDDQITEREEVNFSHPQVLTIDALRYMDILRMEELTPRFVTEDSKKRRLMYKSDIVRKREEEEFKGTSEEFLATLDMHLTISKVKPEDLKRVEELTIRTNQLNSTGYTYSYEELMHFINSENHIFLIAELKDKFGEYGKIGLGLLECENDKMTIKLLLMSCRVMTKGIGSAMLVHFINIARERNKQLFAEFLQTDRNRVMYITYKFMGFDDYEEDGNRFLLKYESDIAKEFPAYLNVELEN